MKLEEAILSHLVTSENVKKAYDQGLSPTHFDGVISDNKKIFEFIVNYWTKSGRESAPTAEVITHSFPGFEFAQPEETLDWLIFEIKKRFKFNNILNVVSKAAELADDGNVDEALRAMSAGSFSIMQQTSNRSSLADFTSNAEDRMARYVERATFTGQVKGAPTGFHEIDLHTFGILPGEVSVTAGFAGTGKTWYLINSALAALRAGFNPYLVSLELSRQDVEDRMDALAARVSHERLTRGSLSREEQDQLLQTHSELSTLSRTLFVDQPSRQERTVQQLVNKTLNNGADFLLVDQLSFIQGTRDRYNSPREKYIEIMNDLKESVSDTDHKLPVSLAVQFNREQKKSGKAESYHMAESAAIEQVADMAFGLNQSNEQRANNAMELLLMKFRRGAGGKAWMLNWNLGDVVEMSVYREMEQDV